MINRALSRRYAHALLDLASEEKAVDSFGAQAAEMAAVVSGHADLSKVLYGGLFATSQRKAIVEELCKKLGSAPSVRKFLLLLVDKDRFQYLPAVVEEYRAMADERAGIARAKVRSASALDDSTKKGISAGLGKYTGRQVECSFETDPALLGGIRAQIGGLVLDGSIKAQLERMTQTLKQG